MTKGTLSTFLKGTKTHRLPKIATLIAATAVLATMVNIDASASPTFLSRAAGASVSTSSAGVGLQSLFNGFGHHHGPDSTTTTTTDPAPTTTTTDPAPTTTTTDPAPTTTTTGPGSTTTTTTDPAPATAFPIGVPNSAEPSGYAPPAANALAGYTQTDVTDFSTVTSLPAGWDVYSGKPGSDPGGQFGGPSHISVSNGVLSLLTYQDPNYGGEWVTGGLSTNIAQTYGADFVRSRVTGAGPTMVELLWPANNLWPPEIDFAESDGATNSLSATVHWGTSSVNHQDQRVLSGIDLTQWNTWGVIWTPTTITYTVNGQVWGQVTNAGEIPDVPMTLDLQQQTWCGATPAWACPSSPQTMQVAWVAEYTPNS